MKLCINCKYSYTDKKRFFKITLLDYRCNYPASHEQYSLVTGEQLLIKAVSCNESRSFERFCGVEGKWFKKK